MMRRRWLARPAPRLSTTDPPPDPYLPPPLALLLARRGIDSPADFLFPETAMLSPWRALPGLEAVVDRLLSCSRRHARILVWGDYDADGLTSTAIMARTLQAAGADVRCHIPERLSEGYGLGRAVLDICASQSPEVLLAVDCGTSSAAEIECLTSSGISVLVLDHHEPGDVHPSADAIANPRLAPSDGAWGDMCAAGICYSAFRGISEACSLPEDLSGYALALSSVGTICDVVPLRRDNRILAACGIPWLASGSVPGLSALARTAGIRPGAMSSEDVSYRIGPRLNACGRMGRTRDALELLLSGGGEASGELCRGIEEMNEARRRLDRQVFDQALAMSAGLAGRRSVLLAERGWHLGVLGIAASRLASELGVPVALASIDDDGIARGSARSVPGVPLHEIFRGMSGMLLAGGGHSQAAGLTFRASDLEALRDRFEELVTAFAPEPAGPVLYLDGRLSEEDLTRDLALGLRKLEPFGEGNEEPVWITSGARISDVRRMGGGRHLGMTAGIGSKSVRAVGFGMGGQGTPSPSLRFDMAYSVRLDDWRGESELVLHLRDIKPC
jgi:single-stranded-DNA-specific exonuclease